MRTLATLSTMALTLGWLSLAAPAVAQEASEPAPYVVLLHATGTDPADLARQQVARHGGSVGHVYRQALKGFSAQLTPAGVAALRADARVAAIEPDHVVRITDQSMPTGIPRAKATANSNLKINGTDDYNADVDIAILDTGIDAAHPDLNVVARTNCLNSSTCTNNSGTDDHGHGSHVAGTAAARDNGLGVVGVAPGARLWSVKVLDAGGSGQLSGVIAGIDWVSSHADEIEVANMSLGCENCNNDAMNQAIANAVGRGVVFVVAAGNNDKDARTFSPANHPDVITVSALADFNGAPGGGAASTCRADQDDTLAEFSNWGPSVEIAAPGVCIYSTYKDGGYNTFSGTSMASPHVAGAAGLLTANGRRATNREGAAAIRQRLMDTGNSAWTDDSGDGYREPLLDVSSTSDYPAGNPDPGRPTAKFTASCSTANTSCSFDASGSSDPDGSICSYAWEFGDGATGSGKNTSRTYAVAGFYSVKLTVTDNAGKSNVTRVMVKAGDLPPTAAFTGRCTRGACSFDGSGSSDAESTIASYSWNFGDGGTATGKTASHSYPNAGATYTVRLTVTDSKGQPGSTTHQVKCYKHISTPLCFYGP